MNSTLESQQLGEAGTGGKPHHAGQTGAGMNPGLANETAVVIANLGDGVFLTDSGGQGRACRRAASCLLLPEPGDTVLLAAVANTHYLLAVLERAAATPLLLQVDGNLCIQSRTGALSLRAEQAIDLCATSVAVQADSAVVTVGKMRFFGALWEGSVNTARLVSQVCETIAERVMQHTKTSFRTVEQIDHVRAGQIDLEGRDLIKLHGRFVVTTADDVVKVDARLMHMG